VQFIDCVVSLPFCQAFLVHWHTLSSLWRDGDVN
jgi:hypothetical protein